MFTAELTFITLTLMILVSISFWMKVPKASIPLFIIYLIFSFTQFSSSENKPIEDTVDSYDNDQNNEKNSLSDLENVEEIKIRGINNYVEPKPLIIEDKSGLSDHKRNEKEKFKKPEKEHSNKKLKSDDLNKPLILKDIKICKNIYKRTPVGADNIFTNNVDSLYCYTRIQNSGSKREVKHVWYYENQIMTQVRYNVKKSNIYRSWTKKTILSNQIGNWRVDIQDNNGTIIGSKKFKIKRLSDYN